jgi:hypothetical protein
VRLSWEDAAAIGAMPARIDVRRGDVPFAELLVDPVAVGATP